MNSKRSAGPMHSPGERHPLQDTTSRRAVPTEETIRENLEYLYPRVFESSTVPLWPPDVFCLCASVLQRSGAYSAVLDTPPPHLLQGTSVDRSGEVERIGKAWRTACNSKGTFPPEIQSCWTVVVKNRNHPIQGLRENKDCVVALLNLLSYADAASHSIGIYAPGVAGTIGCEYSRTADVQLLQTGMKKILGATLCKRIHPSRARVLPKMHTPQNGLTIRSFSHNLAYCQAPGVKPVWLSATGKNSSHTVNLLLVPWPREVSPSQFKDVSKDPLPDRLAPEHHGLFTFEPTPSPTLRHVRKLVRIAERKVGKLDGIVFPELAMSRREFLILSKGLVTPSRFLIAGVGSSATRKHCGANQAVWDIAQRLRQNLILGAHFEQNKHHRWKITKPQIVQYGIGTNLHPEANWWESISLGSRTIAFATLRQWLTMSLLICEDLARPDPVGDILRAVGPNLIIALLSDGPQIASRWAGRYASAFADDPGSSVLTLTSAGMARLSRAMPGSQDRSGTVAMWRDPLTGTRELDLPRDASALVLNLTVKYEREWTADGRDDGRWSGYPILAGYHSIFDSELDN